MLVLILVHPLVPSVARGGAAFAPPSSALHLLFPSPLPLPLPVAAQVRWRGASGATPAVAARAWPVPRRGCAGPERPLARAAPPAAPLRGRRYLPSTARPHAAARPRPPSARRLRCQKTQVKVASLPYCPPFPSPMPGCSVDLCLSAFFARVHLGFPCPDPVFSPPDLCIASTVKPGEPWTTVAWGRAAPATR